MFTFNPELVEGDDDCADEGQAYVREKEEWEEGEVREGNYAKERQAWRGRRQGSERYSFFAVGPASLNREMQIVSTLPALPKAPTVLFFFVLSAKFPVLWLAKRILP